MHYNRRIRVGVLMGGRSLENEVSFNSGRTICDHLDTNKYEIVPIYQSVTGTLYILPWHFLHRGKTTDFEHRLEKQARTLKWDDLKNLIDFMYIATHGRYAEDGTLQGFLEVLGIPYLGAGVYASALRMDKIKHKQVLSTYDIKVPAYIPVCAPQLKDPIIARAYIANQLKEKNINLPCIIKPYNQGSSIGVSPAHTIDELMNAVYKAAQLDGYLQSVVIEEKLVGMEFSCITLVDYKNGGYISLPPTEIVIEADTHIYDYEQKYMHGRATKFTPARCSDEITKKIQHTCIRVMEILEFSAISRIDGFVTHDNEVVIIDPNSLTGMGPASFLFLQAAKINMSHTQLINHLIETELHQYGMLVDNNINSMNETHMIPTQKIRVAVLMGGQSHEKETSLESGRNVTYKLSPHKYEAIPLFASSTMQLYKIDQSLLVRNSTKEIESLVDESMRIDWNDLPTIVDFVFNAFHGGHGENGSVQGTLEMLGLPYNGSGVFASALCMNKYKTNEMLRINNMQVPDNILVNQQEWQQNQATIIDHIINTLSLPLIVKPHDDGCSVMVQKAKTIDDLIAAIDAIFKDGKTYALIEECIVGTELTVGVIGNDTARALPPSQCITAGDILTIEEKFLPGAGENQTPALLPAETIAFVQRTMEQAYTILQCKGYVRIDCFYQNAQQSPTGQERVVILEINTLPGLTPATCLFHQAAEIGMRPMEFIDHIIQLGFELHTKVSIQSTTSPQQHHQ